jgi:hypothetical protein
MKKIFLLVLLIFLFSCEKDETYIEDSPIDNEVLDAQSISDQVNSLGDATIGLDIYLNSRDVNDRSCVNCHLSPTGIDIVQFGKTNINLQDSIVVKRATDHVSLTESYHIAAYLKSLNIQPNDNASLASMIGINNSNGVAPSEIWNGFSSLTTDEINSWDFRNGVIYNFEFPRWFKGDETNTLYDDNLDWLPEIDLITEKGLQSDDKYLSYLNNPTKENLKILLYYAHSLMSEGERNPGEHGFNDFNKSFDYHRWMATLYMQHVINPDSDLVFGEELSDYNIADFSIADGIWDVGNIARRSEDNGTSPSSQINNRLVNEVQWLYLGWLTNYGKRNSFETQYIGTALKEFEEQDLASLVILKSIVNRSPNSQRMYDDIFTMGYITSDDMFYESVTFGLNFLINGINSGDNHFTILNNDSIELILNNLINNSGSPSIKMFVENKEFLSQIEKNNIIDKINILFSLVQEML